MIKYPKRRSIAETSNLFRDAVVSVAEWIGLKKSENRKKNEPRWKRRIEGDIKRLLKEYKRMEKKTKEELEKKKKKKELSELNQRYRVKKKG